MLSDSSPTTSIWKQPIVRWVIALVFVFVFSVILQMLYGVVRVQFVRYMGKYVIEPLVMAGDIPGQTYWILFKQRVVEGADIVLLVIGIVFASLVVTRWLGYRRKWLVVTLTIVLLLFGIIVPDIVMPILDGSRGGCLLIPSAPPSSPPPVGCGPSSWTLWLAL